MGYALRIDSIKFNTWHGALLAFIQVDGWDRIGLFLKRTSTNEKGAFPEGISILSNQSKTVNLLQLSVPQAPLLLHPRGEPSPLLAHDAQPIDFN